MRDQDSLEPAPAVGPPVGLSAPTPAARLRELRALRQPLRLLRAARALSITPRGDGRILLTIPGYGAADGSLLPVRRYLRSRGHDARGWGLGRNDGEGERLLELAADVLHDLAEASGRSVNLLGWSMGGSIARELARDHPDRVHRIATLAAPLTGPRHTAVGERYGEQRLREIDRVIAERRATPITRPVLGLYGRRDGVVDWRACIDLESPEARNVELDTTHFGIGLDPDVWRHLAVWFAPSV